ncbi:hypothetical protein SAMN05428950_10349 [Sphingomonas sp. OV641]|nr:hypothetical protein SAMN05428950_10349 [Sphingomonas sp. OV641]
MPPLTPPIHSGCYVIVACGLKNNEKQLPALLGTDEAPQFLGKIRELELW